jgi:SAM-dependent methyltransferase
MKIHQDFYQSISPEDLQKYAVAAGFGDSYPQDLEHWKKYLSRAKSVLEVGCGAGRLGRVLIKDFDYTGIDPYETYLNTFRQELEKEGKSEAAQKLIKASFLDFQQKSFDAILFPWTIIEDFNKEEQLQVLEHANEMLSDGGVVIIDNPAEGAPSNRAPGYEPTEFFYKDWKDAFSKLGYSHQEVLYYDTLTGRKREVIVLNK